MKTLMIVAVSMLGGAFAQEPIAYWSLDEGAGNEVHDAFNGFDGVVLGPQWVNGLLGTALHFEGTEDRVQMAGPGLQGSNAMSVSLWLNPDSFAVSDARLISRALGTAESDHDWMVSTVSTNGETRLRARLRTGSSTKTLIASSGSLATGLWQHAALVYDGSTMRLYLNGQQVGSTAKTGVVNERSGLNVALGNQPQTAGSKPFHGQIDEVRVYNRALTSVEVQSLATVCDGQPSATFNVTGDGSLAPATLAFDASGSMDCDGTITQYHWDFGDGQGGEGAFTAHGYTAPGIYTVTLQVEDDQLNTASSSQTVSLSDGLPLAHWALDEGVGTLAQDPRGGFHGSLEGPIWVSGIKHGALEFNGSSDRVSMTGPGVTGDQMTLAAWLKADDFDVSDARIVSRASGTAANDHDWMLSTVSSGGLIRLRARLRAGSSTTTLIAASGSVPIGQWVHAAMVYDGATLRLFQDGAEVSSKALAGSINERAGLGVAIGNQPGGAGSRPFDGSIDEVMVFDRALTSSEVSALADPCDGLPVAEFEWERQTNQTVAFDASASTDCDGTLVDYAWDFGDGAFGSGLNPTHVYAPGTYLVLLTVTDDQGHTDQISSALTIYAPGERIDSGLLAEYAMSAGQGTVIHDLSAVSPLMDLTVTQPSNVSWETCGGLTIDQNTLISGTGPATKLNNAIPASGELTVEAWVQAASLAQVGPARIVTLSDGAYDRNFTLGQEGSEYVFRLRTTATGLNGTHPEISTSGGAVGTHPSHIVFTRGGDGVGRLFVDGVMRGSAPLAGDLSNWAGDFSFALANEIGADRSWLGSLFLVAVYDRALDTHEISQNYQAGIPSTCNRAPVARATQSLYHGIAPASVDFDGTASFDLDGTIQQWDWDFGDGDTGSGSALNHVFTGPGSYRVLLTVTDDLGSTDTRSLFVNLVPAGSAVRVDGDLLALYAFQEGTGEQVLDLTGGLNPMDLEIQDPNRVSWLSCGGLSIDNDTILGPVAGGKLFEGIQDGITLEAWVKPANTSQGPSSPARVITYSDTPYARNFTLGQKADEWDVRFRTSETGINGTNPSTTTQGTLASTELTHIAYTWDLSGTAYLYVNGELQATSWIGTDIANWDPTYGFALANEINPQERSFLGEYHLVAVYDRALTSAEVQQNHAAGTTGFSIVAPQVNASADPTQALVDAPVQFHAEVVTACDASVAAWQWNFGDGETSVLAEPSHAYAQPGVYSVTVVVTDDRGEAGQAAISVEITASNQAPSITSTPVTAAVTTQAYSYDVDATDADGDALVYSLTQAPSGMTIDPSTGLITWSPVEADEGNHTVAILVDDQNGGTDTQSFTLTVAPAPNQAPEITSTPVTSAVATQTYSYDVDATDADGDALVYSLTQAPSGMTIDPTTGLITWSPAEADEGDHIVAILVDDQNGGTDSQSFTLTVAPAPNQVPEITSTPVTSAVATQAYSYDADATDADGDALVFSLTQAPSGMTIDPTTGLITWSPAEADEGDHTVAILVDDQNGGTDTQSFTLTVAPAPNQAPEITSTPITGAVATQAYSYDVEATDADGDALVFSLTQAPSGMTIDPVTGLITWSPTEADEGNHTVAILVDDQNGGTDSQSFTLTVAPAPNQAPVITSTPPTIASQFALYQYPVIANDADGDPITFALLESPAGMTIDPQTGLIQWLPTDSEIGIYTITVQAGDDQGAADTQTFILEVPANRAPVFVTTPGRFALPDTAYNYDADAVDPEDDVLTFSLLVGPASLSMDPTSGLVNWTPGSSDLGNHDVQISVVDTAGNQAIQAFTLSVGDLDLIDLCVVVDPDAPGLGYDDADLTNNQTQSQAAICVAAPKAKTHSTISPLPIRRAAQSVIVPGLDLAVTDVDATAVISDPQSLYAAGTLTISLANLGSVELNQPIDIAVFEDLNFNRLYEPGTDLLLGVYPFEEGLSAGATALKSVFVEGVLSFRNAPITVWVDSAQAFTEDRESNNLRHSGLGMSTAAASFPIEPVVKWAWSGSDAYPSFDEVMSTPIVANMTDDNGDGRIDEYDIADVIVVASPEDFGDCNTPGYLFILSGDDGHLINTFTDYMVLPCTTPAVGDIDQDGFPEVLTMGVNDLGQWVWMIFEHDGTFKQQLGHTTDLTRSGAASIVDIDHDGDVELILNAGIYDHNGVRITSNAAYGNVTNSALSVNADLDLNGDNEIINGLRAWRSDNSVYFQGLRSLDTYGYNAVANFDADPYPEIVAVSRGELYLLEHDGTPIWGPEPVGRSVAINIYSGGPPTVADLDGDQVPEIVVADDQLLFVYNADGSMRWTYPIFEDSSGVTSSTAFDFNGDGQMEIVYSDQTYLRIFAGSTGEVLFETPQPSATGLEYPVVADLDNDGSAEIISPSNSIRDYSNLISYTRTGITVYEDAQHRWGAARRIMNQHAYSVTHVNEDGSIPSNPADNWQVPGLNHFRVNAPLASERSLLAAADLSASYLRTNDTNCPTSVGLTARIGNGGAVRAPAGVAVSFYLGGCPGAGGNPIGSTVIPRDLVPGDYVDVTLDYQPGNLGPEFTSTPITAALEDQAYSYQAVAIDPEAGPVTYALLDGPQDLTIDAASGLVSWLPRFSDAGAHRLTLAAYDNLGAATSQSFVVHVAVRPNQPPVITSTAPADATIVRTDETFTYQVTATDPENDPITFSMNEFAEGASIDPITGVITWTPLPNQVPSYFYFNVFATDDHKGFVTQRFRLRAREPNLPPVIVSEPVTSVVEGNLYLYAVQIDDPNNDTITMSMPYLPTGMSFHQATNTIRWSTKIGDAGTYDLTIDVTDGEFSDTQSYQLEVVQWVNTPPEITSQPNTRAIAGQTYSTQITATDVDGHAISYSLELAPPGMTINANSGWISWTPSQADAYPVIVVATDELGASDRQGFTIQVPVRGNTAPQITSTPVSQGFAGLPYLYDVEVTDPDGFPLHFELVTAPVGMAIQPSSGEITWSPTTGDLGDHSVQVRVEDAHGAFDTQTYTLTISDPGDILDPAVSLTASPQSVDPDQPTTLTVTASDNVAVDSLVLTVDGSPLALDINNQAVFSSSLPGVVRAQVTASDAAGNTATAKTDVLVRDAGDSDVPVVDILDPVMDAIVTQPTDILATVQDANLRSWQMEYSFRESLCWTLLAEGTNTFTAQNAATFDPTLLKNGLYEIRLTATDVNGAQSSDFTIVSVEGNMKVGKFALAFQDLSIPLHGIPINIFRSYDSSQTCPGDFGYNWDLATIDVQENILPGSRWKFETYYYQLPLPVPTFCIEGQLDHYVSVTLPGGKTEQFDLKLNGDCTDYQVPVHVTPYYEPRPGTTSQLFVGGTAPTLTFVAQEFEHVLVTDNAEIWNPTEYVLITSDGLVFQIDQNLGLKSISDREGNYVFFNPDGVIHSSGTSIDFTRDAQQRITTITDPRGNTIDYSYDAFGDLVAVTDRAGQTISYSYSYDANHQLLGIISPTGEVPARMEYDADGRLIAQIDANGNRIEYGHDIAGRQETITDRNGNLWVHTYDDRGNVLASVDPSGATTAYTYDTDDRELSKTLAYGTALEATTSRSYDGKDNILSETDPLGHTVSYSYTPTNEPLSITDPAGEVTAFTYDQYGFPLTISDPLGAVTETVYVVNASGNLVSTTTDPLGHVTETEQNRKGQILRETDAAGVDTTYTYDANSNELTRTTTRTDDQGQGVSMTWTREYDANDRVIRELDPYGNETRTEYDANGQVLAQIDALGRRTEMTYDAFGRVTRTDYPDSSFEITTYDEDGNQLTATDRAGRISSFAYDGLNRLVATISADGSSSQTEYDLLGRLDAVIDARGNRTIYGYDLAGRRTSVTDARFETSSYVYDARGNQLSFTDALGHVTSFEYDAKSRRTRTVFHDGSAMSVVYDALDRKVSETDQAGITTAFQYDELGRLASVTDALNEVTSYGYDEQGSRTLQTDALGRNTQWSYDHLGRAIKRTLPLGMFETMSYDPPSQGFGAASGVGNLTARTDFNGHTTSYQHDILSRLQAMTFADGSSQSYGYNESGLRTRSTTTDGDTLYFYDLQDRLIHQENPDGTWLAYSYDEAGNRTSMETANGLTTFTFDQLNRLETVTAPDGAITVYAYDAVGNRQSIQHGNGTQTFYIYDDLNRLIHMEHQDSQGAVLASYDYTLGLAGNRLSVTDHTGRVVDYSYDDLYRLTREDIADPVNGNAFFAYTYDAVANRLTKEDVNGTVTSTYDANDRILTEGVNTYTYDLNGNTLSSVKSGVTTSYTYDHQNRMIGANDGSKLVNYGYNADGIRTWSELDGVRTTFLVDQNRPYAQVLEELDANFNPTVTYVHGDDLLSQFRSGQRFTYHYDGHGSTTALTDTTEAATDTYTYDAWGELLASTGATPNNYLYTGEQYDPNVGFYYLRARYYNPGIGRFHTMDTWGGMQFEPVTLHKYLYAEADPVTRVDPSGNISLIELTTAEKIQATLRSIGTRYAGKKARGQLFNRLGKLVEEAIKEIIEEVIEEAVFQGLSVALNPGDVLFDHKQRRVIDWLGEGVEGLANIEAKYGIPKAGSKAMERLLSQVKAMGSDRKKRAVLLFFKDIDQKDIERLRRSFGPNAGYTEIYSGMSQIAEFARKFFLNAGSGGKFF